MAKDSSKNSEITTAFLKAVKTRRIDEALELIAQGADVTATGDAPGFPPVREAIGMGSVRLMKAIIEAGNLDIHECDGHGWALLHYAARDGQTEIAAALLEMGADIEQPTSQTGWTPLHVAALHGATRATKFLLVNKADPNATADKKSGNTPMHNAAARGMIDDIMTLIAHGGDPLRKNDDGYTPRDFAVMQNQLRAAAKLLDYTQGMEKAERLIRVRTLRRNRLSF